MTAIIGYAGRGALALLRVFIDVSVLIVGTLDWAFVAPFRGRGMRVRSTVTQFVEVGFNAVPVISLICLLMGAILAMQSQYQLDRFGVDYLVPDLVAVAAMRELSPLMTAILVTGRSGSAFTAEIGTMKVSEEVDALDVMGLNPVKYLVVPKFIGTLLAVPMVTLVATFMMMLGGFLLSTQYIGQDVGTYVERSADAFTWNDFLNGMIKSVFFAMTICWVGVYRGFQTEGGAGEVGKMTTSSVVTSIFMIIVVDVIFTYLFFSPT
jgi:phospholipid/cholesterol/gamma-HCH transport system permease protein